MILNPVIILVRPQMGENIGAAARGMGNFGLSTLRLVRPRDSWPNQVATDNGAGAFDHVEVQVFDQLQDALADLHYSFATTARPRDMVKDVYGPAEACLKSHDFLANDQRLGFVFGPERTGLENDEIMLCQSIVSFPVNDMFSSLNLGQSVLLMCYEWVRSQDAQHQDTKKANTEIVTQEKLEEFLVRLETELEAGGFFKSEGLKPTMIRNIRNIFSRGQLTDQEVRTLHGIISALKN